MSIKNLDHTYIAQTYGRYDAVLTEGTADGFTKEIDVNGEKANVTIVKA